MQYQNEFISDVKYKKQHYSLRQLVVGFRYEEQHFVKIVTSLVTVLFKMKLYLCIYFVFTKKPFF